MARWPAARWNPVSTCGPGGLRPIAVTLHHQVGRGDPAGVYEARRVSAHFWIPYAGDPVQHVDTGVRAWHGGTEALNGNCIGVETEGCATSPHAEPMNDHQLTLFGDLMRWANATHGIPLVLSEMATSPGLNYHRCRGGFATACPCQVRVDARAEILRRAGGGGAPAPTPTTKGHGMIDHTPDGKGYFQVLRDGAVYAHGSAVFKGGANQAGHLRPGGQIVGISACANDGYVLMSDDGSVFAYGSAQYLGRADRF